MSTRNHDEYGLRRRGSQKVGFYTNISLYAANSYWKILKDFFRISKVSILRVIQTDFWKIHPCEVHELSFGKSRFMTKPDYWKTRPSLIIDVDEFSRKRPESLAIRRIFQKLRKLANKMYIRKRLNLSFYFR